ncbi:MAG: glutathione S-transferase N-terminal domain-containing protein [Solirubrobacterales bacterium]|nr:glutathione S-transferase N-terminal domain-containing protein [Solirubrobacterales bacterium]MCB1008493.1 glutathione S-transferase N-terminal domain-containing protein [Acidobacteriota bacterium]MCB8969321.1 glutathione S-transferase N-terminal domain-containing protein [Thermoleophilales bacterium]MCO5328427.1 glutathione S-transferase N-terminal domain-containing protein [Solirubrobacterales bacterium]
MSEAKRSGAKPSILLLRCPTPTNHLCPCGAVERRLRRFDLDHRVERVPYRRGDARPEVVELTGQKRVPVLVDGDEVIHDSKRILEYLNWRYGDDAGEEE